MIAVSVNVIDAQVSDLLKSIKDSGLVKLIHRQDIKTYVVHDKELYSQDEEKITVFTDKPEDLDKIVDTIQSSVSDKFLELSINGELEGEQISKLLKGELSKEELESILTDAVKMRFK